MYRTLAMDVMSHSSAFLLPTIPADHRPPQTYALVVLNQSLPRFTPLLWNHGTYPAPSLSLSLCVCSFFLFFNFLRNDPVRAYLLFRAAQLHLCADGGANRVYDEMPLLFPHEDPSHVRTRSFSSLIYIYIPLI